MKNRSQSDFRAPRHFISADDYTVADIHKIFDDARQIKELRLYQDMFWNLKVKNPADRLRYICVALRANRIGRSGRQRQIAMIFNQPSTRTNMSFTKGAQIIGCNVTNLNMDQSSIAKGESLSRTLKMAALDAQVLVVRHGDKKVTLKEIAELFADIPLHRHVSLVNAGEEFREHPTQALLDLFTVREVFKRKVMICLYGDLREGRTTHSVMMLGARLGMNFVCTPGAPGLEMPENYIRYAEEKGSQVIHEADIDKAIEHCDVDVVYATRRQNGHSQDALNGGNPGYGITRRMLSRTKLMHPLPSNGEIEESTDTHPNSLVLQQAGNGIYVRAALLRHCLGIT